jgi:hypothetical protein
MRRASLIKREGEPVPIFDIAGKRILFIQVPKTGGTSVSAALAKLGTKKFDERLTSDKHKISERHAHRDQIENEILDMKFDFTFMVTRHPVDRMISEYRYQCRKPGLHRSRIMGFGLWLRYSLARVRKQRGYRDNHFRPQAEFPIHGCQIFKYEDGLEVAIESLNRQLDLAVRLPSTRMNVSPSFDLNVRSADISRITSFYKSDFETYKYDPIQFTA